MKGPHEGWRTKPAYTIGQAAMLAGTTPANVRRWVYGYDQPGHRMAPVFGPKERPEAPAAVSFLELAEIVVAAAFRKRQLTLERIRSARQFAAERLNLEYPFATLTMKSDGSHILLEYQETEPGVPLLALDMQGQWTLPHAVTESLETFDFDQSWAARWFPLGKSVPIVVDPQRGAGLPTVMDRGVTVDTICRRWKAGQTIAFIASDFKLPRTIVERVLQHGERYAA